MILGDLSYFQARRGVSTETERVLANMQWLSRSFEPLVQRIAEEWPDADPVQRYCDFLHNRLLMAQERGSDIDNREAFDKWLAQGGPGIPAAAWEISELSEP